MWFYNFLGDRQGEGNALISHVYVTRQLPLELEVCLSAVYPITPPDLHQLEEHTQLTE